VNRYVLDSFALLAYIQREPGGAAVKTILQEAATGQSALFISLINLGEVLYQFERRQGQGQLPTLLALLDELPLTLVEVTRARVYAAAHLKAHYAVAYGDTFAVALAQELDATVVTGDPEFRKLGDVVRVKWLPPPGR
jgi:ribonuclease VapC